MPRLSKLYFQKSQCLVALAFFVLMGASSDLRAQDGGTAVVGGTYASLLFGSVDPSLPNFDREWSFGARGGLFLGSQIRLGAATFFYQSEILSYGDLVDSKVQPILGEISYHLNDVFEGFYYGARAGLVYEEEVLSETGQKATENEETFGIFGGLDLMATTTIGFGFEASYLYVLGEPKKYDIFSLSAYITLFL
ncbi:MAG: hypothetical protein CL675_11730 [Bdellovibrionaceae bacterium]|nr:hypothetical protein [Pseudobdellovibrionaceae bacterium]